MIIVGDQLVTDVFVANRAHIKSILIEPISRANGGSKILAFFERIIYKKLAQKNILHDGFYSEEELGGKYEIL
jgi:predicted HAD superfamily phosphohydrolase YqeG